MLIKGTAVRSVLIAVENLAGKEGLERVTRALPSDVKKTVADGVLATTMYPVTVSAALHLAIHDELGHGTWVMNHRVGAAAARVDYGGVYRTILRAFVNYDSVIDRLAQSFRQYNSQGDVRWIERGPGLAKGRVSGVAGYNEGMWWSVGGRVEELLRMCGAKSASTRPFECDETSCLLVARWGA